MNLTPQLLIDGSQPKTPEALLQLLDAQGIQTETLNHDAVFTVEQARAVRPSTGEGHTKNLFVRNKKGRMWLLTAHESRKVNLKETAIALGAKQFSFASEIRLAQYLGVIAGAVSPFALVNDVTRQVRFAFDEDLLSQQYLHIHPLDNRMTTRIKVDDLLRFLKANGHEYAIF